MLIRTIDECKKYTQSTSLNYDIQVDFSGIEDESEISNMVSILSSSEFIDKVIEIRLPDIFFINNKEEILSNTQWFNLCLKQANFLPNLEKMLLDDSGLIELMSENVFRQLIYNSNFNISGCINQLSRPVSFVQDLCKSKFENRDVSESIIIQQELLDKMDPIKKMAFIEQKHVAYFIKIAHEYIKNKSDLSANLDFHILLECIKYNKDIVFNSINVNRVLLSYSSAGADEARIGPFPRATTVLSVLMNDFESIEKIKNIMSDEKILVEEYINRERQIAQGQFFMDQYSILRSLKLSLLMNPVDEDDVQYDFNVISELDSGHCFGLTMLWLYANHALHHREIYGTRRDGSFQHEADDIHWFVDVIKNIPRIKDGTLSIEEKIEIDRFVSHIRYLQSADSMLGRVQNERDGLLSGFDTSDQKFAKTDISFMKINDIQGLLDVAIDHPNSLTQLTIYQHAMAMFYDSENKLLWFYDPDFGSVNIDPSSREHVQWMENLMNKHYQMNPKCEIVSVYNYVSSYVGLIPRIHIIPLDKRLAIPILQRIIGDGFYTPAGIDFFDSAIAHADIDAVKLIIDNTINIVKALNSRAHVATVIDEVVSYVGWMQQSFKGDVKTQRHLMFLFFKELKSKNDQLYASVLQKMHVSDVLPLLSDSVIIDLICAKDNPVSELYDDYLKAVAKKTVQQGEGPVLELIHWVQAMIPFEHKEDSFVTFFQYLKECNVDIFDVIATRFSISRNVPGDSELKSIALELEHERAIAKRLSPDSMRLVTVYGMFDAPARDEYERFTLCLCKWEKSLKMEESSSGRQQETLVQNLLDAILRSAQLRMEGDLEQGKTIDDMHMLQKSRGSVMDWLAHDNQLALRTSVVTHNDEWQSVIEQFTGLMRRSLKR